MSFFGTAAMLDDFERSSVTVEVPGASVRDALGRVSQPMTVVPRTPVVHPAGRRQIERLPESDRSRETIAIYDTIEYAQSSVVTYQARRYKVTHVGDYQQHGGVYLVLASLLDDHGGAS